MSSKSVLSNLNNGVRIIKFNRPEKKNALSKEVYEILTKILNEDANNDNVVVTILTGVGDYYSSGNDLMSSLETFQDDNSEESKRKKVKPVEDLINAFINYPKLLIAVINGPAIGIAVTSAALCDVVYASDRATFQTPFVKLGLCAEGCSSYLFPRILGRSKASEMLLLGHKMTAKEAYQFGFVSEVIEHQKLPELFKCLANYGKLPVNSVKVTKQLVNKNIKPTLCECHKHEINQLIECFESEDFGNAITKFLSMKNKL